MIDVNSANITLSATSRCRSETFVGIAGQRPTTCWQQLIGSACFSNAANIWISRAKAQDCELSHTSKISPLARRGTPAFKGSPTVFLHAGQSHRRSDRACPVGTEPVIFDQGADRWLGVKELVEGYGRPLTLASGAVRFARRVAGSDHRLARHIVRGHDGSDPQHGLGGETPR